MSRTIEESVADSLPEALRAGLVELEHLLALREGVLGMVESMS